MKAKETPHKGLFVQISATETGSPDPVRGRTDRPMRTRSSIIQNTMLGATSNVRQDASSGICQPRARVVRNPYASTMHRTTI